MSPIFYAAIIIGAGYNGLEMAVFSGEGWTLRAGFETTRNTKRKSARA